MKRTVHADEESQPLKGLDPDDKESQSSKGLDAVPPANATSIAPSSLGGSSSSPANNPIFLAKMVMRKVLSILITDDEGGDVGPSVEGYSVIGFLKDVLIGVAMGLVTISLMIFLDREFHVYFIVYIMSCYFMECPLMRISILFANLFAVTFPSCRYQCHPPSIGTQLS